MSVRSRLARQTAREILRCPSYGGPDARLDPAEVRSWVESIQRSWGTPHEWRAGRRGTGRKAKRRLP